MTRRRLPDLARLAATRRQVLAAGAAVGLAAAAGRPGPALAEEAFGAESHGLSTFGDLALPADAAAMPYANPAAPKGGAMSLQISRTLANQAFDTFNTLNIFVLKGDGAAGMLDTFDTLMARNFDEPDALYGLVARSVALSPDRLALRFRLRPEARFHDGSRLTAADVAFSIGVLRDKGHPDFALPLKHVTGIETPDEATVLVRLDPARPRDLPQVIATLPIFSKAYYATKPFEESSLEPPLASGPYKVARFEQGRFIEFERVPDYWAADLAVNRGQNNFDRLRYEYFRDRQVALEGLKAAVVTFREEFTSRDWAMAYDVPAVREGRILRETVPDETPSGAQGWFFNLRRPQFADRRVREALTLLFDFEWTNQNLMAGQYQRTSSFFENSPMKAMGRPGPDELALLEPLRAQVPDEVFGEPFGPPVTDGSGQDRALLRRADGLLREAGCNREGGSLRLPDGKPFEIEFLEGSPGLERHTNGLIKNLGLVGIQARYRLVDPAQFQRRIEEFDFDVMSRRLGGAPTPGIELRLQWGSASARVNGSPNITGLADPAVDALVDKALSAETRTGLTAACKALDRVLRAQRIWIPMWYKPSHWLAYWDMFGKPAAKPKYDRGAPATWWYDADKAKRIGKG